MPSPRPITGTAQLWAVLSPHVPDEFINQLLPGNRVQGRRPYFSAAQLWRVHLLALLTSAHSFNGEARLLPEQPAWRRFAPLDHRYRTPDVRMPCEIVAGDWGYMPRQTKKEIRQEWQVAVVTRMKKDRRMVEPFDAWDQARCEQGQSLPWLGCGDELHWFGVRTADSLCHRRREASHGPKGFGHRPDQHETLPGLLPLNTLAAKRLLQPARAWIEPAQAYEKNVRGRGDLFLNSLRLTWTMCLLADAVGLLRAWALLDLPQKDPRLRAWLPQQMSGERKNLASPKK